MPDSPTKIPGGESNHNIEKPKESIEKNNKSIATLPEQFAIWQKENPGNKEYAAATEGNNSPDMTYDYSGKERSIRFLLILTEVCAAL